MDAKEAQWADRHLGRLMTLVDADPLVAALGGRRGKDGVKWWRNAVGQARWELAELFRGDKVFGRDHRMVHGLIPQYEWMDDLLSGAEFCATMGGPDLRTEKFREKLKILRCRLDGILEKLYADEKVERLMRRQAQLSINPDKEPDYTEEECEKVRR